MKTFLRAAIAFLFLFCGYFVQAQVTVKHPRVVELEKYLTKEALDFLRGRFPDHPFMVSISVDPLHRQSRSPDAAKETLPYYVVSDAEITDEWDDPSLTNPTLMARVKKIQVVLSLPATLGDDEVAELKQAIVSNLGLIEARDGIEVRKRSFSSNVVKEDKTSAYLGWGAAAWVAFMAGLFGVVWLSASRISYALAQANAKTQQSGSSYGGMAAVAPGVSTSEGSGEKGGKGLAGDVRFSDPIKTREVISATVKRLEEHAGFPTLEDMIILTKFSEDYPSSLGALLSEFPHELTKKIFSYSFGNSWLEALHDPGDVDHNSMSTLNKLIRLQRSEVEKEMQELLVFVWRLEGRQIEFLKGLSSSEAMTILQQLPASIAIASAREVFPGAWAGLLDSSHKHEVLSTERIQKLKAQALKLMPLRDWAIVSKYKSDRELLGYLKVADPAAEKEIYLASGNDKMLESIRAPFYKVFECSDEVYDKLVQRVSIEEWAISLFNVGRAERRQIEKRFSDKQKFRYFELLKSFDSNPPSKSKVGDVRERVARALLVSQKEVSANSENVEKANATSTAA